MDSAIDAIATRRRPMRLAEIEEGVARQRTRQVTTADIQAFGALSGDFNPVHFDDAYAADTMFRGVVAHGMLSAAFFSGVIGEELPGPGAIYMGQTLRFRGPVRPGDVVRAVCTVTAVDRERRRLTIACEAWVGETLVLDGEALVKAPAD